MALSRPLHLCSDFDAEVVISVRGLSGDLLLGPKAFPARELFPQVQAELLAGRPGLISEEADSSTLVKLFFQGEQLDADSAFGTEHVALTAVFQAAQGPQRREGSFPNIYKRVHRVDMRHILIVDTPGFADCHHWLPPWFLRPIMVRRAPKVDIRLLSVEVDDALLEKWSEPSQRQRVRDGLEEELRSALPPFIVRGIDVEALRFELRGAVDRVPRAFALADAYLKKKREYQFSYDWVYFPDKETSTSEEIVEACKAGCKAHEAARWHALQRYDGRSPKRFSRAEIRKCLPWPAKKLRDVRSAQRCSSRLRWH